MKSDKKKSTRIIIKIFYIIFTVLFIVPILLIVFIDIIRQRTRFSGYLRNIKQGGYIITKSKFKNQTVYLFTRNIIVIRFLANEIYDISFDSGHTYIPITESNIGTCDEREQLKHLINQYHNCDYRDKDMYDSTEAMVNFILKNCN